MRCLRPRRLNLPISYLLYEVVPHGSSEDSTHPRAFPYDCCYRGNLFCPCQDRGNLVRAERYRDPLGTEYWCGHEPFPYSPSSFILSERDLCITSVTGTGQCPHPHGGSWMLSTRHAGQGSPAGA